MNGKRDPKLRKSSTFLIAFGILVLSCFSGWGAQLRYVETSRPDLLNPIDGSRNVVGVRLLQLIFRGMIGQDRRGEWVPEMALALPVLDTEAREMTINLKDGLQWPDGQPITAEDVVHSFRIYTDKRSRYGSINIFELFEQVEAVDQNTVRFKLTEGDPRAISRSGFFIVPKHKIGEDTFLAPENNFNREPMGAGPYQVVRVEPNRIQLGPNSRYYKPAPPIDDVQLIVNADENIQHSLLLSGFVDMDPVVRPQDLPGLQASLDVGVIPYDSQSWYGFAYNCKNDFLKFKEFRQALSYAFHADDALQASFQGQGLLVSGPYTPSSFCFNPEVNPYPYEPQKTGEMLDRLGFIDIKGEGIREQDGKPLRLRMVLSKGMSQDNKDICANFAQQLGAQKIKVDIDWQEENAWYKKVFFDHDYDITFVSWKFDEGSNIYPLFSKTEQGPGQYNITQFEHDGIQEYLERFRETKDDGERAELGQRLHEMLHEQAPYTFLWTLEHNSAYRSDLLSRVIIHPFYFFTFIEEWELY
jgi:peptide/nickel transport system substrate-binding protein